MARTKETDWRSLRDPEALLPFLGNPRAVQEYLLYRSFEETPGAIDAFYLSLFYGADPESFDGVSLTDDQRAMFRELSAKSNVRLDYVYALVDVMPGDLVLDGGCGPGGGLFRLHRQGARVIGLDRNRAHVEVTASIMGRLGVAAPVVHGDLLRLPFCSASFKRVVLADVVEHVNDKDALFAEIHRVLTPGGSAVVHTDSELRVDLGVWARRILAMMRMQDPRRWRAAWSGIEGGHTGVVTPDRLRAHMSRRGFATQVRMQRWRALTSYIVIGRRRTG